MPKVFLSYSWESEEHKDWVMGLAARLRADAVETILDQWHAIPGDQLPAFMEKAVRESNYVLIICTPGYRERSDQRKGGVGYEGDIMTGEVFTTKEERKFIPILRSASWKESAPTWLKGKLYIDLQGTPYSQDQYRTLLMTLLGTLPTAPPVAARIDVLTASRSIPDRRPAPLVADHFEPISIERLITEQIGTPRADGTPGSSLYKVPFRLSRRPPGEWADFFIEEWNQPRSYTSAHRSGIARIFADTVVLDGTTLEEVEKHHQATLKLAAHEANRRFIELEGKRKLADERERQRIEMHRQSVDDAAKRIKF